MVDNSLKGILNSKKVENQYSKYKKTKKQQ